MGAAALALMLGGQALSSYGDAKSNSAMRGTLGAENARQAALDQELAGDQRQLITSGTFGAGAIPKQQAATAADAAAYDQIAKNVTGAAAANAGSAPASARPGIVSGADGVAGGSRLLSELLARRQAMAAAGGDQQVALDDYGIDRTRLRDRAMGSAALLPYALETAARAGDTYRDLGTIGSLAGQGYMSYSANRPSNQPLGYSNSPYAYNRLQGPAR